MDRAELPCGRAGIERARMRAKANTAESVFMGFLEFLNGLDQIAVKQPKHFCGNRNLFPEFWVTIHRVQHNFSVVGYVITSDPLEK